MILILAYTAGTTTLPVLGFTAITMAFGHLHEVSQANSFPNPNPNPNPNTNLNPSPTPTPYPYP